MATDVFGKEQGETNLEFEQQLADIERRLGLAKSLEVVATGVLDVTIAAVPGNYVASFTHNLGYAPAFIAFWLFGTSYRQLPSYWFKNDATLAYKLDASTDNDTFDVELFYLGASPSGFPASPLKVKFYLFREPSQ